MDKDLEVPLRFEDALLLLPLELLGPKNKFPNFYSCSG